MISKVVEAVVIASSRYVATVACWCKTRTSSKIERNSNEDLLGQQVVLALQRIYPRRA